MPFARDNTGRALARANADGALDNPLFDLAVKVEREAALALRKQLAASAEDRLEWTTLVQAGGSEA